MKSIDGLQRSTQGPSPQPSSFEPFESKPSTDPVYGVQSFIAMECAWTEAAAMRTVPAESQPSPFEDTAGATAGPPIPQDQPPVYLASRYPALYVLWCFAFIGGGVIVVVASVFMKPEALFGERRTSSIWFDNVLPWYWNKDDLRAAGLLEAPTSRLSRETTSEEASTEVPDALKSYDAFCYRQTAEENETTLNDTGPEFVAPHAVRKRSHLIVCIYNRTSLQRSPPYGYYPRQVALRYCTHLIYYSPLTTDGYRLVYRNPGLDRDFGMDQVRRIADRRRYNVSLLVSIGGDEADNANWSRLVSREKNMRAFADDVLEVLKTHKYNGVNLHWTHPGGRCGRPGDVPAFTRLIRLLLSYLRSPEGGQAFLISVMLPYQDRLLELNYQLKPLSKLADLLIVETHDLYGPGSPSVRCPSPYEAKQGLSLKTILKKTSLRVYHGFWKKVCASVTFLATTFSVDNTMNSRGPGSSQPFTNQLGKAAYFEVCDWSKLNTSSMDSECTLRVKGNTVAALEDVDSLTRKLSGFAVDGYGSVCLAVFNMDMDDFLGRCKGGGGVMSPLLKRMYEDVFHR